MSSTEWKKENTISIHIQVTKASGIPDALERMTDETGQKATAYARKLLEDGLIRDGYLAYKDIQNK